ncbi:hypothetical protein POM88_049734 [Heracleum sosnowskyi]|uniref:Uncharacterized protein n=1 Tax=Heracleum sosnowskyi TaxID=360622 RepID=A0AAD8M1Y8_9APIA|nr:hypothetical protein POM88_049734 [Heracleum sosnowskyi]
MATKKKKSSEEMKGGGGHAIWSKDTVYSFCDVCIQFSEKSKGKRGSAISQRMNWKVLGWEHEKWTISAREEWWKNKIEKNIQFKAFKDEGIEPELESKMDQLFGVSAAQVLHRFTLVQNEKEYIYIPSPPSNANLGDALGFYDNEMIEGDILNNIQSNMEWKDVWDDNSPNPSPQSNECDVTRRGSKIVSNNSDASESS